MIELAIFLHSLIVGFMLFFIGVVSPVVFKSLNNEVAGIFLRRLFPRMFLYGMILALIAFILTINNYTSIYWIISLVSAFFFATNLFFITPRINQFRDEANLGNSQSEKNFKRFHFLSVFLFMIQLLGSLYLLTIFFY